MFKVAFWSLMTAAMVAGVCYNLYAVSDKYFSYPVSVGIAIEHANDLNFPAVTICNMSPLRATAVNQTEILASSAKRRKKRSSWWPTGVTVTVQQNSVISCILT